MLVSFREAERGEVTSWRAFEASPRVTPGATSNLGVECVLGVDRGPIPLTLHF